TGEGILPRHGREAWLAGMAGLRHRFPNLLLPDSILKGYRRPPQSPDECIFSRTTLNLTADLKGRITPCQFGGSPDCSQCGCIASAGLQAVAEHRLFGVVPLRSIFAVSTQIGRVN